MPFCSHLWRASVCLTAWPGLHRRPSYFSRILSQDLQGLNIGHGSCWYMVETYTTQESNQFSSVQLLSHIWLFATPRTAARQASLSITNSPSLLKLMSVELVMPSNHFILCHSLFLLPSIFPSIRVFSNESALRIRWPNYWSFSFNISPSNEYSGLIFFKMDWLDLLAVRGTLKNLLQHHSSKASILWRSAFFIVQLSRPYNPPIKIKYIH